MQVKVKFLAIFVMLVSSLSLVAQTVPAGSFRVGAAKTDITPTKEEMAKGMLGVLDNLYARAIVIDNGHTSAALVTLDAGAVRAEMAKNIKARAEKELGIPGVNVLLTATHTHSAGTGFGAPAQRYEDAVFQSIKEAKAKLQPARIGYGTGVSYINVQRDNIDPKTHGWWEGANYGGLSDKTVAVVKFEALNGDPIAVYFNYAMHAVITGVLDLVSGDVPGAAERYVESALGGKAIALWSEGACGDQNPIFFQQTFDLRDIRIKDYAKRGEDISNSLPPGGQGMDRNNPEVARLMNEQKQMILSMGQMLGEEVLHVMRTTEKTQGDGRILGNEKTVTCPGRVRTDKGRGGVQGTYQDGPDVNIGLGLLMIDDIAIGTVNGEVYNEIAQRLKRESPYAKTIMATLTNGMANSGYIPDDASFGHQTFEVLSTRLKPGCAETAITSGIESMMPRVVY